MPGNSVTVIGAGGNIGSHLVPHLGRMAGLGRVTLVDRDTYEERNLVSQDITPRDVGKHKVAAQAARLRRINPALHVETVAGAVEHAPVGRLRADVILACLDSRVARQHVNEIAWRLGAPWIDAGVRSGGLLARIKMYVPAEDAPCLECAWTESDYATVEQVYPCQGRALREPADADLPSALGALAASLQALECQKLLAGRREPGIAGRQVTIDADSHKHYVTSFRRNPGCRFDHQTWRVERFPYRPGQYTVAAALRLGSPLWLEGKPFARKLTCARCGRSRRLWRLACSLRANQRSCPRCDGSMEAGGFNLIERLQWPLPEHLLARTLADIGLRPGDVFCAGDKHYEIASDGM